MTPPLATIALCARRGDPIKTDDEWAKAIAHDERNRRTHRVREGDERETHARKVREALSERPALSEVAVRERARALLDEIGQDRVDIASVVTMRQRWAEEVMLKGKGNIVPGQLVDRHRQRGTTLVWEIAIEGPEALLAASWTLIAPIRECAATTEREASKTPERMFELDLGRTVFELKREEVGQRSRSGGATPRGTKVDSKTMNERAREGVREDTRMA